MVEDWSRMKDVKGDGEGRWWGVGEEEAYGWIVVVTGMGLDC